MKFSLILFYLKKKKLIVIMKQKEDTPGRFKSLQGGRVLLYLHLDLDREIMKES